MNPISVIIKFKCSHHMSCSLGGSGTAPQLLIPSYMIYFLLLQLYFNTGLNEYVEPGFAAIRSPINTNNNKEEDVELHG